MRHPRSYSKPADAWAAGCILAEMLNFGYPIMPVSSLYNQFLKGNNEIDQFKQMCKLLGRPSHSVWPGFYDVENHKHLLSLVGPDYKHNAVGSKFENLSENCIDLLNGLLAWDPDERLTVRFPL